MWRPSYLHLGAEGRSLRHQTVGQALQAAAERWPLRPCLVTPGGRSTSYSQLLEEVDRLASGLLESGLQRGDRLAIYGPGSLPWVTSLLAASRAGLVSVPINPQYVEGELRACLKAVGARGLLAPSAHRGRDLAPLLRALAPSLQTLITLDDSKLDGALTYKEVLSRSSAASWQAISSSQHLIPPESDFIALFTSGTTGEPKVVLQTHFAYVNNSLELGRRNEFSDEYHKMCLQIPLFHAFGLMTFLSALQHGATTVLPYEVYSVQQAARAIAREGCTVVTGTPTMYVDLVRLQGSDPPGPLQIALTGGAPCSEQLAQQVRDRLGIRSLKSVYGMTEACVIFQNVPGDDVLRAADSVGKLYPNSEVKVVDSEGRTVRMGEAGELWVRSYANMRGYCGGPGGSGGALTAEGWLRTGDQFVLHEDGYGQLCGRLKDIIIRGGQNIFPKEIEDILNTHPDITEAHVFGVSDDRLGEEICAAVRLREGSHLELPALAAFCSRSLAPFKVPRLLRPLRPLQHVPATPSGKVQRYKLREMVERGLM